MSSKCKAGARFYDLSSIKKAILRAHNEKRDLVAGGKFSGFSAAVSMATMVWSNELAEMAGLNVRRCKFSHDCSHTFNYPLSGQNIATLPWSGTVPNLEALLSKTIDMWFSEYNITTMADIKKYPQNTGGRMIGHFTAIVGEANIAVGCAASDNSDQSQYYKYLYVACNYAYTNMIGEEIYRSGGVAGSKCLTGRNRIHPNLCSIKEKYNVKGYLA